MEIDVAQPEEYAEIGALNVAAYEQYRAVVGEETWAGMRAALEGVDELAAGAELLVARAEGRLLGP